MTDLRAALIDLLQSGETPLQPLATREFVVYGAGNCGRSLAAAAGRAGFQILAFLDVRADSIREVSGIPCFLPESEEARRAAAANVPVVIGIFNCGVDLRPVVELLRGIGFTQIVSFYEIHEHLDDTSQFWLTKRSYYRERQAEILAGLDLFDDRKSQEIYCEHMALRLTFDFQLLTSPDMANQYLPTDLPPPRLPMRLIDGGAFTGDTLRAFAKEGIVLEAVAACEPDLQNFHKLRETVAEDSGQYGSVTLLPCGLWNDTGIARFSAGHGASSSLRSETTEGLTSAQSQTPVVALDHVFPSFAPTFIKLDIEGSEPEALLGAENMIARFHPTLAVCVYHAPEHLWTIPALIRRLWPDCRLALRYHWYNGFEVVAYAYPG